MRFPAALQQKCNKLHLSADARAELVEISAHKRRYVLAILASGQCLAELAVTIGVSASTLYDVRQEVMDLLGPKSRLAQLIYPKLAREKQIDEEPRCDKCGLRGHTREHCDLLPIDFYAGRRYEH